MKQDDRLKQDLNRIPVPGELEQTLRKNWQAQRGSNESQNRFNHSMIAVAASLALISVLSFQISSTPAVVSSAVDDILKDAQLNPGITVPLNTLLTNFDMAMPENNANIAMTKHCKINGKQAVHIKVSGEQKGEVHFFVKQGEFDTVFWQSRQGEQKDMPWRIIETSKNYSVLVLQSEDMDSRNVQNMIETMFLT